MNKTLAYSDGREHGRRAGTWYECNDPAAVLKGIEDGDPAIMDTFVIPDLSGEWSGAPTPEHVAGLYSRRPSPERLDELCTDWLDGASEGYMAEVERHLRALVS